MTHLSGTLIPLLDENENYYGSFGIVEDATEQEHEEKIPSNIIEIYKKLDTIYKDSPVISFLMTAEKDWPVEFVSENIAQFGYTPEDFIRGHIIYSDIIHPDDREMVRFETSRLEMSVGSHFKGEYRILTKSGEVRWVLDRTWLERDQSGIPAYYQGIIIDINDLKKTEEELQKHADELSKANEELKSLDKMKDEFLSNVSHELKTPLISIIGYGEIMNDGTLGPLNEQQKKAMEAVDRNSARLRRLIDSLLYLSISQARMVKYIPNPTQMAEVIDDVIVKMSTETEKKSLTIEKDVPDDLPPINGDKDHLKQVIINLVDNAIKFTPSGGLITVKAKDEGENLHIEVKDTGIGIPDELIVDIFKPFYQLDGSTRRKYGGTGMGLHICKTIIDVHKGEIWIESEEGVGTTVHVKLPK